MEGKWTLEGHALINPDGRAKIELPYEPGAEYDLHMVVKRVAGDDCLVIGLVAAGRQFLVVLDAWPRQGHKSGLQCVDGKEAIENETTRTGRILEINKQIYIICSVRKDAVVVRANDAKLIDYRGGVKRLTLS